MPTSYEPVNVNPSTPGCLTRALPTTEPRPVSTWTAPAGMPAAINTSYSWSAEIDPVTDGLRITVLPVASAAIVGPAASAIGKLNGEMTPHTPWGRITDVFFSASDS